MQVAFGRVVLGSGLVLCLAAGACDREDVHAYRAPKQNGAVQPQPSGAPHGDMAQPGAVAAEVTWTIPQGWEQVATDQAMRVATFKAGAQQL